jgi:hypothetical protein
MSMTCFLSRHRSLRPQAVTGTGTHLDSSCSVGDLTPMCNRFRSIKEWSDLPRRFHGGPRLNFEFNPNVAPTELVPILVAGQGVVLARFGINRCHRERRESRSVTAETKLAASKGVHPIRTSPAVLSARTHANGVFQLRD